VAERCSGCEKLGHRLPAQTSGSAHFHNDLETRLPSAKVTQAEQLGARQNLAFQQPKHNRLIAKKDFAEQGHHVVNLTHGSAATDALVTQVRRAHPMLLKQEHLRIAEPASGRQMGAVASRAQTSKQACLGTPLKRGMNSHASCGLQLTAETPTRKQQRHEFISDGEESGS
jgi:hypothetical protein